MSVALGEAIRRARVRKGLTLRQLANRVGVSAPFLSDLEHGRRNTNRLADFARVLGVSLAALEKVAAHVDQSLKAWIEANPGLVAILRNARNCRCGIRLDRTKGTP